MKRNRFIGAFAVEKNIDKLNACWERDKTLLPDSSFLKLFYEGSQIKFNTIDNITVLFHGEIFKYLDVIPGSINESIIESIIWLYKKFGDGFAKNIDGHFAIIIYDQLIEKLLVIQDKYTFYEKIFWIQKNNIFYFSNSIKTLSKCSKIDPNEISTTALYHFLRYTYTTPPHTIFKNVYQMMIGEMIVIKNEKLSKSTYDNWSFSDNRIKDKNEAVALYKEILTKSIYRLYENHPTSVFLLSGGLDSSLNVALASQITRKPIISIGIAAEDKFNTDAPYARMVSKLFNTDHHEYHFDGHEINDLPQIVYTMGVPYFEPGVMLSYSAYMEAAKYSNYAIGGEAADQIFGYCTPAAYRRYSIQEKTYGLYKPFYNLTKNVCRSKLFGGSYIARKAEGRLIDIYDVNSLCSAFGFRNGEIRELLKEDFYFQDKYDDSNVPDKGLSQLYDFCCTKLDIDYAFYGILSVYSHLSELHNITCHSAYTDREVINFALSLDHNLRIQMTNSQDIQFVTKYLHRELAKELLPPEIINRPKQGGAVKNSIHVIDDDFVNRIKIKLLNSEIINRYFRTSVIEKLFVSPHLNPTKILLLINLDLWHHLFVSGPSEQIPSYTLTEYIK